MHSGFFFVYLLIASQLLADHSLGLRLGAMLGAGIPGVKNGRPAGEREYRGVAAVMAADAKGKGALCSVVVINSCFVSNRHCVTQPEYKDLSIQFPGPPNRDNPLAPILPAEKIEIARIKNGDMDLRFSKKDGVTGDLVVGKLVRQPKYSYTESILAQKLPSAYGRFVQEEKTGVWQIKTHRHVKGIIVGFGSEESKFTLTKRFNENYKRIKTLRKGSPEYDDAAEEIKRDGTRILRIREGQDKQIGKVQILGDANLVLGGRDRIGFIVSISSPATPEGGDSGGPLFYEDETGKERLLALNTATTSKEETDAVFPGLPPYQLAASIPANYDFLMKSLGDLGCIH